MIKSIDTWIISFDISDYETSIKELGKRLEQHKNNAAEKLNKLSSDIEMCNIGNLSFEILGNGKKGYAYILHNELLEVNIAQYRSNNEEFYPVMIRFKQEYLWNKGYDEAFEEVYAFVSNNIGKVKAMKVNRIDLCCHTDKITSLEYSDMGKFKGSWRKGSIYIQDRAINGFYFGSSTSGLLCRIYNKTREVLTKKKALWFFKVWKDHGLNPNNVWNIEFQLKRDFLKKFEGLDNPLDLVVRLNNLWKYLTCEWIVKVENPQETHLERCIITPYWQDVQSNFNYISNVELVKKLDQKEYDADVLIPQIFGCITSFAGKRNVDDMEYIAQEIFYKGTKYLKSKNSTFEKEVAIKSKVQNNYPEQEKYYFNIQQQTEDMPF